MGSGAAGARASARAAGGRLAGPGRLVCQRVKCPPRLGTCEDRVFV